MQRVGGSIYPPAHPTKLPNPCIPGFQPAPLNKSRPPVDSNRKSGAHSAINSLVNFAPPHPRGMVVLRLSIARLDTTSQANMLA